MLRSKTQRGFTLIEIMVALGIAAGALLLLISTGHESMRRSLRSEERSHVDELAQSKLNEIRFGIESSERGRFENEPNLSWEVVREAAELDSIKNMERLTLQVRSQASGNVLHAISIYHLNPKVSKE